MSKAPQQRYADCRELAEDLRRWQEGEPIQARPLPPWERIWRWAQRNPLLAMLVATSAALLLLVALVSGIASVQTSRALKTAEAERQRAEDALGREAAERKRAESALAREATERKRAETALAKTTEAERQRALAQVDTLRRAEIGQVPFLIESLKPVWTEVAPRIKELITAKDLPEKERLRLSLALVPEDPKLASYLQQRLFDAEASEFLVIRNALMPFAGQISKPLWDIALDPQAAGDRGFRAACALAGLDAGAAPAKWNALRDRTASVLCGQNPLVLGTWLAALRPVRQTLVPALQNVFRDPQTGEGERSVAASILADYAADQPQVLAEMLLDADAKQFAVVFPAVQAHTQQAVSLWEAELDQQVAEDAKDEERDKLASRQANAAVALLRLSPSEKAWQVFQHRPDPTARSHLIHRAAPLGVDPQRIVTRLDQEKDVSSRRALLLSLGEFGEDRLPPTERQRLIPKLLNLYRDDPDAGIHGAAEWVLRQWKQQDQFKEIDQQLATGQLQGDRQWYVNGQGQTMAIVRGPIEFLMGSPAGETERDSDETLHRRRIGRSFAIATKEVTVEQWERFLQADAEMYRVFQGSEEYKQRYYPDAACPHGAITWYEAAAYCNWLSGQEGVPRNQWCYEPNQEGSLPKG